MTKIQLWRLSCLVLIGFAFMPASMAGLPTERIMLQNGMEVLLLPDPASQLVTSIVVVRAGSSRENPRTSGASHFLEHMLFNGTDRRTQKQLYEEEDAAGGFNNAFTRRTHAAFMMTLPAERLDLALDLQADMLFHSRLANGKFEKERGIILEELAKDRESESYVLERILEAETFPESSFGLPVLGTEHSIRALSRGEVREFYERNYVPENMLAVLLGRFDPVEAKERLEETLGAQPARGDWSKPAPRPAPIRAARVMRHSAELSRSWIRLVWNGPDPGAPDFLACRTTAELLFNGDQSPLAQALNRTHAAMVRSVRGGIVAGEDFGRLIIDIEAAPGADLEEISATAQSLIEERTAPSEARLSAWKVAAEAEEIFARQRGYMYAPLYSEDLALLGTWGLQMRLEHITALTCSDVNKATQTLAGGPCVTILIAAPPGAEDAPVAMDPMMGASMPPAMQKMMSSGGMKRARPAAEDAPAAPVDLPYSVQDTLLSNGTHLLAMDAPADGSLSIYVLIEGRNYLEPEGKEGITELLHSLLPAGSGAMTEVEFAAALEGMGGEIQCADRGFIPFDDYYTARDFSFVRFQALDRFAPEAFALLGQMLTSPRFDQGPFERNRGRMVGRLERDAASAAGAADRRLQELLISPEHPEARSAFGSATSVAGIAREDLRTHHARLMDPRRMWIGVVSGHPFTQLCQWSQDLVPSSAGADSPTLHMTPERYALWEARGDLGAAAAAQWRALQADPEAHGLESHESGSLLLDRAASTGRQRAHVQEICLLPEGADQAAELAVGWLSSQLAFELREKQGLAYGIGASLWRLGSRAFYAAGAGTRPENVAAMRDGLLAIRHAARDAAAKLPASEVRRIANKRYGRVLRRQEVRLNQAMFSVWSARRGEDPLTWWRAARTLRDVPETDMRRLLEEIASSEPTLLMIID